MTKKEIKKNLKRTIKIESMLLDMLANPNLSDDEAVLVTREVISAVEFIVRFEACLKEMEGK